MAAGRLDESSQVLPSVDHTHGPLFRCCPVIHVPYVISFTVYSLMTGKLRLKSGVTLNQQPVSYSISGYLHTHRQSLTTGSMIILHSNNLYINGMWV